LQICLRCIFWAAPVNGGIFHLPAGVLPIADRFTIVLIFMSLLKNAIENTPDGGEVKISLYRQSGSIVIEVKGSGVGITEQSRRCRFLQNLLNSCLFFYEPYSATGFPYECPCSLSPPELVDLTSCRYCSGLIRGISFAIVTRPHNSFSS
jgi:hypothetical protein